jgi:hypothetical protein
MNLCSDNHYTVSTNPRSTLLKMMIPNAATSSVKTKLTLNDSNENDP